MFDSNILLTKFGPGFWFRVPGVGPGFYSFPNKSLIYWAGGRWGGEEVGSGGKGGKGGGGRG